MPEWTGYHVKTDGRAYFRPYIPKDLKYALGPLPMVNLRMRGSREAERLALSHYIAHESLLATKRQEILTASLRPRPLALCEYTPERIRKFAAELAQGFNRTQHAALRGQAPRSELDTLHDLLAQVAGDVLSATGVDGMSNITEIFLHAAYVPYTRDEPNFKELVFEFATALDTEFVRPSIRRLQGREAVPPPPLPALRGSVVDPARLTLGSVIERHLKAQKQTGYTRKVVRCLRLFQAVLGAETPVESIRQLHVTDFLRNICRLPSNWAHRFDSGAATIPAMMAEVAPEAMAPLTYTDNYRAPLKAFLRDARRDFGDEGFPVLIVDGIEYSGDREPGEDKQRALTVPELQVLIEGPQFAAIAAGPQHACMYWFTVLALFTGARPRELCQANPQVDFGQEGGHWYIDLTEHTAAGKGIEKTIKTGEERRIPLHPELIRLGFPEYVERLKASGKDRLFPSFRVKKGNPFEAAGDDFTALLKVVGLYDDKAPPGKVVLGAYVMRKTFITQCRNQNVVSKEITGHSDGLTTAVQERSYAERVEPFARKLSELRKLSLPLSIPMR